MAARIRKIRHDENTKDKIQASQIINRLQKHIDGIVDLKPTQVTAAIALLRKVVPDVTESTVTYNRGAQEMSDADLLARLAEIRGRGVARDAVTAPAAPTKPH